MESIQQFDESLFVLINQKLTNSALDLIFPFLTNFFKTPLFLYALLPLGLGFWIYKKRMGAVKVFVALALLAGVCDLISYWGIKTVVKRPRPNHIASLNSVVRVPYGPKSPSLPSNHAVTTFALMALLARRYKHLAPFFWFYAAMMGYSRIYVGVHFPTDIVAGAFLGVFIEWLMRTQLYAKVKWFSSGLKLKSQSTYL